MPPPTLLLYGANGYTGALIARAAKARGMTPILAGRNAAALNALADELNLEYRVFGLDDAQLLKQHLQDVNVVLHCAGPFSATSAPMVEACLQTRTHYLDITGEIDVFEAIRQQDELAKAQGVLLMPGCGFDVVPTDCLALMLKHRLPDATRLILAFASSGRPSRGTAKTMIEGFKVGGRIRENGKLRQVPLAYKVTTLPFFTGPQLAMTIPWGDVSTAYVTTGIPNIEVYLGVTPAQVKQVKRMRYWRWLVSRGWVQTYLKKKIDRRRPGPTDEERQKAKTVVYGRVENEAGQWAEIQLLTPNGYDLTVEASLRIVEHVLKNDVPSGYSTPAQLMGENFILSLPDVKIMFSSETEMTNRND